MLHLEWEFLREPVKHADVFLRAAAAVDLDFLAFDYSYSTSRGVVIWEANPYPFIPPLSDTLLGHTRKSAGKVEGMNAAFADGLSALLT